MSHSSLSNAEFGGTSDCFQHMPMTLCVVAGERQKTPSAKRLPMYVIKSSGSTTDRRWSR
ncbi:MAG: hypothetical protein NT138_02190 [Planctomycetales bacterium]|nr:hypothetical protein [Planctomycetales bacterium]